RGEVSRSMRMVQWARRLCFATAGALVVLSLLAPTFARADEDPDVGRPFLWRGEASAAGIFQTLDREHQLSALYQTLYGRAPDGLTTWGNNVADARAATYYAGAFSGAAGL